MKQVEWQGRTLFDAEPELADFRADVRRGLGMDPPQVPPKYFYDERGSQLFEQITELPEYYPTRTELGILQDCVDEVAERCGAGLRVVEFGSGSGLKTELLLRALPGVRAYTPIDISLEALRLCVERLEAAFPELPIQAVRADYTQDHELPDLSGGAEGVLAFFPGSTLGNFTYEEATAWFVHAAQLLGSGGRLLLGTDLLKDPAILQRAYDDAAGVTAAFNLNLLTRMQRELGAELDPAGYRHEALFNGAERRVEMWLRNDAAQRIGLDGEEFELAPGQGIWTESSYKYERSIVAELSATAGFEIEAGWQDERAWFGVWLLRC